MLYPRLTLARELLAEDGVLFCSIDDRNQAYVKCLFDEIFGEENFVACCPRLTTKGSQAPCNVSKDHDYLLIYSIKKENLTFSNTDLETDGFSHEDEYYRERGDYYLQPLDTSRNYSESQDYEVEFNGVKFYPGGKEKWLERQNGRSTENWSWRWSKERLQFGIENGFIEIKNNRIYTRTYYKVRISLHKPYRIEEVQRQKNVSSIEFIEKQYANYVAREEIQQIFNEKNLCNYSKPIALIKRLIQLSSTQDKEAIILDFFAGSGTTGHAVLELNREDGGNRKFILCQLNEKTETTPNGIAYDVAAKRLKRIMTGECYDGTKPEKWLEENEPYGGSLEVYDIGSVANFETTAGQTPFEVIDETLYGKEKFSTVKEKIEWVCSNFEKTQKYLEESDLNKGRGD